MKGTPLEQTTTICLLGSMDLSTNKLDVFISEELAELPGFRSLNLSHNSLSGNIPSNIGGLRSIVSHDLSDSLLFGAIPQSISTIKSSNYLILSYNNLSGENPKGNPLQTHKDPSIYAGNLHLCRDLLPKKCRDDDVTKPSMTTGNEDEDDEEDEKEKILFYFVVASGYATGLWAVIGMRVAYFPFVENAKEWMLATIQLKIARLKKRIKGPRSEGD